MSNGLWDTWGILEREWTDDSPARGEKDKVLWKKKNIGRNETKFKVNEMIIKETLKDKERHDRVRVSSRKM